MKQQYNSLSVKTRRQIADEFGMHVNTLMRKLKKEGIELSRGLVAPKEQLKIYELLGYPTHSNLR